VTDLASATAAIEAIVEQGEGPRGDWRDAHFGRFKRVLDEYLAMRAADPTFEPARPAAWLSEAVQPIGAISTALTGYAQRLKSSV
jgi:hypothetical protein